MDYDRGKRGRTPNRRFTNRGYRRGNMRGNYYPWRPNWSHNNHHYNSHYSYPPRPPKPPSPLPGTEEYRQRNIQQTSELIKKQLNIDGSVCTEVNVVSNEPKATENVAEPKKEETSQSSVNVGEKKSKNKKNQVEEEAIDVLEIYDKIIKHISNMSYSKKLNLINQSSSGYDIAIQQIQKQKQLELSKALRDMSQRPILDTDEEVIQSIIPDIGIKIEDLPNDVIKELSQTLQINFKSDVTDMEVDESKESQVIDMTISPEDVDKEMVIKNVINEDKSGNDALIENIFDFEYLNKTENYDDSYEETKPEVVSGIGEESEFSMANIDVTKSYLNMSMGLDFNKSSGSGLIRIKTDIFQSPKKDKVLNNPKLSLEDNLVENKIGEEVLKPILEKENLLGANKSPKSNLVIPIEQIKSSPGPSTTNLLSQSDSNPPFKANLEEKIVSPVSASFDRIIQTHFSPLIRDVQTPTNQLLTTEQPKKWKSPGEKKMLPLENNQSKTPPSIEANNMNQMNQQSDGAMKGKEEKIEEKNDKNLVDDKNKYKKKKKAKVEKVEKNKNVENENKSKNSKPSQENLITFKEMGTMVNFDSKHKRKKRNMEVQTDSDSNLLLKPKENKEISTMTDSSTNLVTVSAQTPMKFFKKNYQSKSNQTLPINCKSIEIQATEKMKTSTTQTDFVKENDDNKRKNTALLTQLRLMQEIDEEIKELLIKRKSLYDNLDLLSNYSSKSDNGTKSDVNKGDNVIKGEMSKGEISKDQSMRGENVSKGDHHSMRGENVAKSDHHSMKGEISKGDHSMRGENLTKSDHHSMKGEISKGDHSMRGENVAKSDHHSMKGEISKGDHSMRGENLTKSDHHSMRGENLTKGDQHSMKGEISKGEHSMKGDYSMKGDHSMKGDYSMKGENITKGDHSMKGDHSIKTDSSIKSDHSIRGEHTSKSEHPNKSDYATKSDNLTKTDKGDTPKNDNLTKTNRKKRSRKHEKIIEQNKIEKIIDEPPNKLLDTSKMSEDENISKFSDPIQPDPNSSQSEQELQEITTRIKPKPKESKDKERIQQSPIQKDQQKQSTLSTTTTTTEPIKEKPLKLSLRIEKDENNVKKYSLKRDRSLSKDKEQKLSAEIDEISPEMNVPDKRYKISKDVERLVYNDNKFMKRCCVKLKPLKSNEFFRDNSAENEYEKTLENLEGNSRSPGVHRDVVHSGRNSAMSEHLGEVSPHSSCSTSSNISGKPKSKVIDKLEFKGLTGSIFSLKVIEENLLAAGDNGILYIYNVISQELMTTIQLSTQALTCLHVTKAFSNNECLIYVGCLDGQLRVVNYASKELEKTINIDRPIQCMDICWDTVFTGSTSGDLTIYNSKTSKLEDSIHIFDNRIYAIKAMQEGPRKVLLIGTKDTELSIRDAMTGLLMREFKTNFSPTIYSILCEQNLVYCGTNQHDVLAYSFQDGELIKRYEGIASRRVICMQIVNNLLFVGCFNGSVCVFHKMTHQYLGHMIRPGESLLSMIIVNNKVIVGLKNNKLVIWDVPDVYLEKNR